MIGAGRIAALALSGLFAYAVCAGPAATQGAGPDETVKPDGAIAENWSLTPAQRIAIYNAVVGQTVKPRPGRVPVAAGMPVPRAAELPELPPQAGFVGAAGRLRYGVVGGDIVIVDPVEMRVVDIIRGVSAPGQ